MLRSPPAALAPLGLLLLCLPVLAISTAILWSLLSGTDPLADPEAVLRRAEYPSPLTLHILGGIALLALGAAQVTPALRRRYPRWHVHSGRFLVGAGFAMAMTGLLMNAHPAAQDDSLAYDAAQTLAALGLMACLALGLRAARRRNIPRHRVWMARAYALSLGAATQTILILPVALAFGPPTGALSDAVLIAAWPLNLFVAELLLRKAPQ